MRKTDCQNLMKLFIEELSVAIRKMLRHHQKIDEMVFKKDELIFERSSNQISILQIWSFMVLETIYS